MRAQTSPQYRAMEGHGVRGPREDGPEWLRSTVGGRDSAEGLFASGPRIQAEIQSFYDDIPSMMT